MPSTLAAEDVVKRIAAHFDFVNDRADLLVVRRQK
jgi:hypothetical protein